MRLASDLKEYQNKMVYQLVQQKFLTAELYKLLAGHYPEYADFWSSISEEELEHASWLEYLFKKVQEEFVVFEEKGIKTYTITAFLAYLQDAIKLAKDEKPSLSKALSLTLDIERSLLEKRLFEHFIGQDREMSTLIRDLKRKMRDHGERIDKKASGLLKSLKTA